MVDDGGSKPHRWKRERERLLELESVDNGKMRKDDRGISGGW